LRIKQRGFTLVEIMLAVAVLVVGAYLTAEGVNQMDSAAKDTRLLSSTERTINAIADNIRTSLGSYQITYDASVATKNKMLDVAKLPMAWGPGLIVSVTTCTATKSCPIGRYGFLITPMPNYRGLYSVTLRMTTPEWKDAYREFTFLATVQ
jgi:prepilin-type N-terminal cleavage/methylation domain-containing protein